MIFQTRADKLTINNTKGDYQSHVYLAQSAEAGTTGLGQLFIIVEARSREKKIPVILSQIIDELSEYYYHSPTKNTEAALETTAQYFNENIMDITGKDLRWVREKMSVLMTAIQDDKLILTNHGNVKLWLLRDNKIHDVTGGQSEEVKQNSKKILANLISGQLLNNDILLLTNNAIFDYFSDEKIRKTITSLAPTQACAFFKNTLIDYKVPVDFSSIVVKFSAFNKEQKDMRDQTAKNVLPVDNDLEKLSRAEPGLIVRLPLLVGQLLKKLRQKVTELRYKIWSKKGNQIKKTPVVNSPASREDLKEKEKSFLGILKKLKNIGLRESRLIIFIVIIALLFGGSLLMLSNKKEQSAQVEQFQTVVDQINDKLNSVEAALIYKDEKKAEELLLEARTMLATFQGETPEQQYAYQEIKSAVEAQINKIYKLEKLENLEVVANLPANFQATSNIYLGDNNIIYLARGGEIYKANSLMKGVDKVAEIQGKIVKIIGWEKNSLLFWTEQKTIWLFDTSNNSMRKIEMSLPTSASRIKDVASYGKKLYVLDEDANSIYKYAFNTTNFGGAVKWNNTNEEDLTNNLAIAVDGNVWLSASEGKISKFFKGKKEVFAINGAYEPLSDKTIIYTSEALDNLYLLDKGKNRVLITDKNGNVKRQLMGSELGEILSIAPNSNEQEFYLLSTDKIYRVKN